MIYFYVSESIIYQYPYDFVEKKYLEKNNVKKSNFYFYCILNYIL
ncbi:hypothetical protein Belba_1345 [Belliella baltica DSM 15883]|uniref:Uncharacterized protein n=1 Tax=Belliella baltica (strain DSM 15883 / CIP 108006 / LMG 21964 / BA134) TaxID=866536 RepID=I3Z401_BELBD|nr:hypothetical protein Belba_1345 [Belliella baltica DSM 15883]